MSKVYVPGYGYVDSSGPGTSGSVGSGSKPRDTGQGRPTPTTNQAPRPTPTPSAANPYDALGVPPSQSYITNYGMPGTGTTATDAPKRLSDLYEYPSWIELDQRTRDLYKDIAVAYNPLSEGKTWYEEQFLPYVNQIKAKTGIAPDPTYVAIRFAQQNGYDISKYFRSSPVLSPNSILYDMPGGSPSPDSNSSSSGSSYSGGGGGGGYGGGGSGGGGGQVSLTNPSSARGLLMQTMQNVLGRNPTDSEYRDFLKTLQESEMANPATVSVDGSTVVQSGGVDPNLIALEYAQAADGFKEQQARKYYDVFMQALAQAGGSVNA